ncbi:transposable element Tc3 transposase [Trichonephila clavipes]|nr:transposable element Tc3 transposase [Trichonephila clavipes]
MEASEEIKEKIIFWKTKLSSKIRRINSDSIQSRNANKESESLGVKGESYSNLLTPILLKQIPSELVLEFNRSQKNEGFDLSALMHFLHLEIRSRERASQINNHKLCHYSPPPQDRTKNKGSYFPGQRMKPPSNRVHFRPHSFPSLLEKVELRSRKCLYCNKGHELDACRSFSANEKREILRKKGCYLCLSPGHRAMECVKRESCLICNGSHHFSICYRNRHDDDLSPKRDTDNIVSAVLKTEVNSVPWCAKIEDKVEKLAYQLNEEAEQTERPIRRLSKVMYGSTCADMQVDVMGECLSSIKHVVGARRNRRQTAGEIARHTTQATGRPISRFTVARRLHGGGLFARRPVRCVPLTPSHRRRRSLWCREHRNWRDNEWGRVLFTDESRFSLSSDSHRILIWRERGSRNHSSNIIERDRYGGRGVLVWGGIMLRSRKDLHIFGAGSVNGTRYCNEILLPYVRLFRSAMGLQFLFMDNNAPCHRTVAAEQLLE